MTVLIIDSTALAVRERLICSCDCNKFLMRGLVTARLYISILGRQFSTGIVYELTDSYQDDIFCSKFYKLA